jgi:hypothetical protein
MMSSIPTCGHRQQAGHVAAVHRGFSRLPGYARAFDRLCARLADVKSSHSPA